MMSTPGIDVTVCSRCGEVRLIGGTRLGFVDPDGLDPLGYVPYVDLMNDPIREGCAVCYCRDVVLVSEWYGVKSDK